MPPSSAAASPRCARPGCRPIVAVDDDGRVLGFCWARPFRPIAAYGRTVEDSIHVASRRAPAWGRTRAAGGPDRSPVERLGCRQMIAVVGDARNLASIRLHESLGFKAVGFLPGAGHKPGGPVDVVLLAAGTGRGKQAAGTGAIIVRRRLRRFAPGNDGKFGGAYLGIGLSRPAQRPIPRWCGSKRGGTHHGDDGPTSRPHGGPRHPGSGAATIIQSGTATARPTAATAISIKGGAGNDLIDGGNGLDRVEYLEATAAVVVNLSAGTASGGGGLDTLRGIEIVEGSSFNDIISGDSRDNTLRGGDGSDNLFGNDGDDEIGGKLGADRLFGEGGNDVLSEIDGGNLLDGGAGQDQAYFQGANTWLDVDLAAGTCSLGGVANTLVDIEDIKGANGANYLLGIGIANRLDGYQFDDFMDGRGERTCLLGQGGNDLLYGAGGADHLEGGVGDRPASWPGRQRRDAGDPRRRPDCRYRWRQYDRGRRRQRLCPGLGHDRRGGRRRRSPPASARPCCAGVSATTTSAAAPAPSK